MGLNLKSILINAAENECQNKVQNIKNDLASFKEMLLKISNQKTHHHTLWVLGEEVEAKDEMHLELLEKAGLVISKKGYSDQSAYLEYSLTDKGKTVVEAIKS